MTAAESGWGWERIDAEIMAGGLDVAAFAAGSGLEAGDAERFVRVRRALLEGRADRAAGGEGLTEAGLATAGVGARDIAVYLRVAEVVGGRTGGRGGIAM